MASDILKTFGIMLKLEGVNDVKKTLNELDARVSNITRQTVDKIKVEKENLRLMREQAKVANEQSRAEERSKKFSAEFSAKSLISAEKVKQATIKTTESAIKKDQAGWKFKIARENEKIKREKALEKEKSKRVKEEFKVAKISQAATGGTSKGGGISRSIWSAGGGLMALQALGKMALWGGRKLLGSLMDIGQQGVALSRIKEGAKNPDQLIKTISDLEQSGWVRGLGRGQMVSFVSQLRQQFDEAFRLKGQDNFFKQWGLGGAKFGSFEEFFMSLLSKGKTKQQRTAIRAAARVDEAEALLNYTTFPDNIFSNIEDQINAMGKLNLSINKLQMELAKLAPYIADIAAWSLSRLKDIKEKISDAAKDLGFSEKDSEAIAMGSMLAGTLASFQLLRKSPKILLKTGELAAKYSIRGLQLAFANPAFSAGVGLTGFVASEGYNMINTAANTTSPIDMPTAHSKKGSRLWYDIGGMRKGLQSPQSIWDKYPESQQSDWFRNYFPEGFKGATNTTNNNHSFNFNINVSGGTMTPTQMKELGYNISTAVNEALYG